MKQLSALLFATLACVALGQKPTGDGFPSGQKTPEGVACDLARAFIQKDAALFRKSVLPPYGGPDLQKDYKRRINLLVTNIKSAAKRNPGGPKQILTCYAARNLTKSGPASYAYATFGFKDVKFVDVKVLMTNGKTFLNRTLVIQDGSKWYVHPLPTMSPLLSDGLNEESASTKTIKGG